ncbi:MAG TPA: tetratricopeptide repeat protein, partial [Clostridia bacterium]|nr:tetratricopeptide repeat protein [Clostridia bacterium]
LGLNNIPRTYINKIGISKEILVLSNRLFELSLKNKNNNPYRRLKDQIGMERSRDELDKLLWLAIKHNKTEEYETAIRYFEELIAKGPEFKKNERVRLHIIESYEGKGNELLKGEKYEEALRYFKKALVYDLNHPVILCDIAVAYLNIDNLDRAERYARRAVEIAPEYEIGKDILNDIKNLQKKIK